MYVQQGIKLDSKPGVLITSLESQLKVHELRTLSKIRSEDPER
jgi:hypothetical protein